MQIYSDNAFNSGYYVSMSPLLEIVADQSTERLRKINYDYLIEVVEILEGPMLTDSTETLSKNMPLYFEISKLQERFFGVYCNAMYQLKMDVRIYYGDLSISAFEEVFLLEQRKWGKQCQVHEDILTVPLLAIKEAQAIFPQIFVYLSKKGPEEYQELASRCHYAAISTTNTIELRLVMDNLQKKIDLVFNRKDLMIQFPSFSKTKGEMRMIFDKYNDTASFEQERCNLCAKQDELWIQISHPEAGVLKSRRMTTMLGYFFQKYFFLELENCIVYLQTKLD